MTDKELMQQALDALKLAKSSHNMVLSSDPPQSAWRYYDVDMKLQETITALDKRLAQNEQEPWATREDFYRELNRSVEHMQRQMEIKTVTMRCTDYDLALPVIRVRDGHVLVGQVTTPPPRPLVGLTEEELESMAEQYVTDCYFDTLKYARAIEARLKEQK